MVGRSIANILDRGAIFTEARSTEVNMPPRSDIEAMDRPTVLYVIYRMVSAQQTNLSVCDGRILSKRRHFLLGGLFPLYRTSSQYIISYSCAITIRYI